MLVVSVHLVDDVGDAVFSVEACTGAVEFDDSNGFVVLVYRDVDFTLTICISDCDVHSGVVSVGFAYQVDGGCFLSEFDVGKCDLQVVELRVLDRDAGCTIFEQAQNIMDVSLGNCRCVEAGQDL